MEQVPLGLLMNLSAWLDDDFYTSGCFFPLKQEGKIILAKGGAWKEVPAEGAVQFQVRDFYHHQKSYYHPEEVLIVTLAEIQAALPQVSSCFKLSDEQKFEGLFQKDFNFFQNSLPELKKAVLMSRLEYTVDEPTTLKKRAFYRALFSTIGEPYGFWFGPYAMIGSTPEILFECKDDLINSFALAGTAPLAESAELLSEKNQYEHDLVIKNIMEDLAPFCLELNCLETLTAPYGRLVHLKTLIEGKLKNNFKSDELISAMSPTAALGGYPRNLAKNFLQRTEYFKAFPVRFHGSVFTVSYENIQRSLVMIRNIQLQNKTLILEAGAGVVSASQEESELKEIYQKLSATRENLL
jgi:isochorismate synthase EntC